MADTRFNRAFVNDAQGNAVYVNQGAGQAGNLGGRIQNLPGGYVGGFIGDAANPGHIQRQLVVNGEVLARYGDAPNTEKLPTSSSEKPTYQNTAEFKLNAAPLKLKGANLDPVAYTIVGGETLKDIARNVLGDASLWWRIADANGLSVSGYGQLTPGQTLSVPKLALNSNNIETFQPYDPSQMTGSTDPLLPAPAGQGGRGCGGLGRIIMVVVVVVVVVASIYTAGAASALLGTAGTTLSGAMAAGSAALTGGGLAGIGAGAMAIGGAVGSIASQAVGNLIGAQDGFSWRSVGLSAIGGGISGGMGGWAPLGEATSTGTAVGNAMIRAAVGNVASQGIGVVTGLQSSFSWQSVAASAVGAGVGQAVGGALGMNERGFSELSFGQQFGTRLLTGVAAGTAAALARGGRVAIQQVATDAFGNALGSSLAAAMSSPGTQESSLYSLSGGRSGQGLQAPGAWGNPGWSGNSAAYDQLVGAFSNPGVVDRSSDVLFAAGPGYNGGTGSNSQRGENIARMLRQGNEPEAMGSVIPPYRDEVRGIGSTGLENGDLWYPSTNTLVGSLDDWDANNAGNGLRVPNYGSMTPVGDVEGFFTFNPAGRALKGVGTALFDAWTVLPNAMRGLGTLASDVHGYASNAIAPQRSVLTGQPFAYQPQSALLQSIQYQGMLGTLGSGITGAVRNAPGIGLIGVLEAPSRDWGNVGTQLVSTGLAGGAAVGAGVMRSAWTVTTADLAAGMRYEASQAATSTTPFLRSMAEANGGEMLGLQYSLKATDSLARKINLNSTDKINDALRYTMSFDEANFTSGVQDALSGLKAQGYQQIALNNTFKAGRPYLGINSTYLTPEGQMFELQFHTSASFQMKDVVNHPLYELQRVLPKTDPVWQSLQQQMIQNSSTVPIPPGASTIKRWK